MLPASALFHQQYCRTVGRDTNDHHVPFEICSQYQAPRYVNNKTLFIASSYSGNTEEVLSALEDAKTKGAHIVAIASGGKLQKIYLDETRELGQSRDPDLIELDEALKNFASLYPRETKVVELKFFGGLDLPLPQQ